MKIFNKDLTEFEEPPSVHAQAELEDALEKNGDQCCGVNLDWVQQEGEPWQEYVPQTATCSICDDYFERRPDSEIFYRSRDGGKTYECGKCGSNISGAQIAHSIHDGPFPNTGSGECEYETVPYCKNCEKKARFSWYSNHTLINI